MEALPVNVMRDLVNQNIIKVEITQVIASVTRTEIERMRTKENARTPTHAVACQFAASRLFLLAGSGQQEDRTQTLARS